jgi:hypothetical protein
VLLAWLVLRDDPESSLDSLSKLQESANHSEANDLELVADLEKPTTDPIGIQREELRDADGLPLTAEVLARRVLVRAELTTLEDEQGHAPKNCKGWVVTAQSWDEETGSIERFTAVANRHGVAEFQFPDFVHIDWVRCDPPLDSGYGLAYLEDHEDIYAGDNYLALLHVMPRRRAFGQVVDWDNRPVSGAEVHVFGDFGDNGISEWTPGLAATTTDGNGRFEFDQLARGDWSFGVTPDVWMMYEPTLSSQDEGSGYVYIDDDVSGPTDAGIIRVMPMTTVELIVVDRRGEPAAGVSGYVEARDYDNPRILDPGEEWIEEDFEEDNPNRKFEWPYDGLGFTTDKNGIAMLPVARGLWNIEFDEFTGDFPGIYELPSLEFRGDGGQLFYKLPVAVGNLSGRFVFADQRPAVGAFASLAYEEDGGTYELGEECGADGRFDFPSLDLNTSYTLRVYPDLDGGSAMFFPQTWMVDPEADSGRDFVVKGAIQSKVRLQRTDGNRSFDKITARLFLTHWEAGNSTIETADDTWWQEAKDWSEKVADKNSLKLPPMPDGFATLELRLAQPTGSWNKYGYANVRLETIQTWRIAIDGGTTHLDADLQGYEATPRNSTQHTGVVVDAESGEAINNALIVFYCAQGPIQTRVNSGKGFNFYSVADIGTIHVNAGGYVTLVVPDYAYQPGKHEHRFELQANSPSFELLVLDRLGTVVAPESLKLLGERGENLLAPPPPPIPPDPLPGMEIFGGQYGSPSLPSTPMSTNVFPSHHKSARVVPGLRPGRVKALATFATGVTAEGWFTAPTASHSMVEVRLNKSQAEINKEIIIQTELNQK